MPRIRHIILTSFSKIDSLELFEQKTLPSVLRQSCKKFLWLWLVPFGEDDMREELKQLAAGEVCCKGFSVEVLTTKEPRRCSSIVAGRLQNGEWLLTTDVPPNRPLSIGCIREVQKIVSKSIDSFRGVFIGKPVDSTFKGVVVRVDQPAVSLLELPRSDSLYLTVYFSDEEASVLS